MKMYAFALAAASLGGAGCVLVHHEDDVRAGDPLDAQLYLTWETKDSHTGARLDCRSVGADTVRVAARNSSTEKTYTDLFGCDAPAGKTFSLTAGDYYIDVDLVSCGPDTAACQTPRVVSRASTVGPYGVWTNEEFDLGHFVFLVE